MDSFHKRIRYERERKGLTLKRTSEYLKLNSTSTYSNWEYGMTEPSYENLVNIANLFEVSIDYLLTGKNSNTNTTNIPTEDFELLRNLKKLEPTQRNMVNSLIDSYLPKKGKSTTLMNGETNETA